MAKKSPQRVESIVERLAMQAIRLGADLLEIEYKEGYEEVVAAKGEVGHAIARFRSSSPEAVALREELHGIAKKKRRMAVGGLQYELRGSVYDSFGEDAFRVELRRVPEGNRVILKPLRTTWSRQFLELAGSAPDFPYPEESPPRKN